MLLLFLAIDTKGITSSTEALTKSNSINPILWILTGKTRLYFKF